MFRPSDRYRHRGAGVGNGSPCWAWRGRAGGVGASLLSASGDPLLRRRSRPARCARILAGGFARGNGGHRDPCDGCAGRCRIVLVFLDLFKIDPGPMRRLLVDGRHRRLDTMNNAPERAPNMGIIILAGLVGVLIVTCGLTILLPDLKM